MTLIKDTKAIPMLSCMPILVRQTGIVSNGAVRIRAFTVALTRIIDTARIELTTSASDYKVGVAIYDHDGNLVFNVNSITAVTPLEIKEGTGTVTVIPPGLYYFGVAANDTTGQLRGLTMPNPSSGQIAWRTGTANETATVDATQVVMPTSIDPSQISEDSSFQPFVQFYYSAASP